MSVLTLILGLPVALAVWLAILTRWRRGITMLLVYLPFAGGVALLLRPNPYGSLIKDFLFVLPAYAAFLLFNLHQLRLVRVPPPVTLLLLAFGALVVLQLFNPGLKSIVMGAVGIKVWLLYLPLMFLVAATIETTEDLVRFLRLQVVVGMVPCVFGLVQFAMCASLGYEAAMTLIYGKSAFDATQGFASFVMGAEFYRLPSTFSFVTQYSGHTLVMIVLCYMQRSIDPSLRWQNFGRVMLAVSIVAAMLSGARANFLFAPLLLLTILFLDAKLTRMASGLIFGPVIMVTTLQAVGFDILKVVGRTTGLVREYGGGLVFPQLMKAMINHPLGSGTGTNTGPALNVVPAPVRGTLSLTEGFYAKAVIELGLPGLLLLLLIIGALIFYGFRVHRSLRSAEARACSAAVVGFIIIMALHSLKGWQVDLDPINVWYWVLAGLLFRLPALRFDHLARRRPAVQRPRRFAGGRAPHPAGQFTAPRR